MNERRTPGGAGAQRQPTKPAKKKGKKKRKFSVRKALIGLFFTAALTVVCGIVGYLVIIVNGERILEANADKEFMAEASVIYDINENEISKLMVENRDVVAFSDMPELLRNAFVAVEDRRFYDHSGLDFIAIGRAVVKDIIARSAVEGGSTITQQLAKNMYLTHDKTLLRKATEASISVALENNYSKDQILEMYLNRIYFGKGAHGVKAASELYFGKSDLSKLEIWEIATLAALPKAPNSYNPLNSPERSKERRAVVLSLMYNQGLITEEEMNAAKEEEYDADMARLPDNRKFMNFVDYAIEEAMDLTSMTEEELRLGGFQIYTTLNPSVQQNIESAFEDDNNFEESPDTQKVQGAMIIIDHRTGEIEGMVGGRDYEKKGTNRVTVQRQPGSAFKPITSYGPALETGNWFPWSILRDDKECFNGYCPSDSNRVKYIGPVSMKQAMKESRNLPAVWLLNQIGVKQGVDFANMLGFNLSAEDRNLAIALGGLTHGVTPLQMATGYSVFANGGKSVDPHTIVRIKNKEGKAVYEYNAPKAKQLVSADTAWYMTELLQSVLEQGGTGTRARIDRPVAGKTGTTQHGIPGLQSSSNRDVWFVGYTPEWTAAVWMGYDKTDKDHLLKQSSGQAAELFAKVMSAALKDVPKSSFIKPAGVKEVKAPAQVGGYSAVYVPDRGEVQLSWTGVEGKDITYRVYRKESSEADFIRLHDQVNAIAAEDITIEEGKTYQYYVTAYDTVHNLEGPPSTIRTIEVPVEEINIPDLLDPLLPDSEDDPDPDFSNDNGQPDEGSLPPEDSGESQDDDNVDEDMDGEPEADVTGNEPDNQSNSNV